MVPSYIPAVSFSQRVVAGLVAGVAVGLFFGELVAPLRVLADAFVRLLQMTVLPYVVLAITVNLGSLTYRNVRRAGPRVAAAMATMWAIAVVFACLFPLAFPDIDSAAFYSPPAAASAEPFSLLELYVPSNPFYSLANSIVPAVVLFAVLLGLALIGVENKAPLLEVLQGAMTAVARVTRFIVRLTPIGIFAIAAHAAGTLDVQDIQRIGVYLACYTAFAVLLALWVIPGVVSVLTPIRPGELLASSRDALLTAFLVGDLFIVLPALMDACSELMARHATGPAAVRNLPASIIPTTFTFPHAGKLLSISFVLFAGWFADSAVPVVRYPQLIASGFFSFFGSLNGAIPFLLDLFRIPADTFQLFLATGVVNSHFGALVAAVHTMAVGLIGSAAIAGAIRVNKTRLVQFAVTTTVLAATVIVGVRMGSVRFLSPATDGRAIVYAMQPRSEAPIDNAGVIAPADVTAASIPQPDGILEGIRTRGQLRVGLIGDGIPYAYRNDENQLVGFDVEMAQRLALDLGVDLQFVRFAQEDLDAMVRARIVDIVMTGARVTPERAAAFATSVPYLEETLAIVTPDYSRQRFASWDQIRDLGPIRVGVQNLPYYIGTVRQLMPDADLTVIEETTELLDPDAPFDAYVLPAERGSVLTMLNPRFSVVVPEGATVRMPLAYPIAGEDDAWVRYVDTWIGLKRGEGLVDDLYRHWILGQAAVARVPRWSVVRNVFGWVD